MNTVALFVWSREDSCVVTRRSRADLPALDVPPSSRVPALVQRWCRERELQASFVSVIGGVGRANGSVHWGAWVRLDRPANGYTSLPLSVIETRTSDAATRQLAKALRTTLDTSGCSRWLGHNPHWPEIVQAWIARRCSTNRVSAVTPIRSEASSIVASATLDGRDVFFTTRPLPFRDKDICDLLDRQAPGSFPQTLAYDEPRGWWLTADVCARDLKTRVERSERARGLPRIMRGLARVQRATANVPSIGKLAYNISLDGLRAGVRRALDASQREVGWTESARETLQVGVESLWERAGAHHVSDSWVHSDPSPDNVRVNERGGTAFIDLHDPWYGPMLLMGALALHGLSRRCGWTEAEPATRCRPAWQEYVNACDLAPDHHTIADWLRLALLVRLVRGLDRLAVEPGLLLHEESPRRSYAVAHELHRLLGAS